MQESCKLFIYCILFTGLLLFAFKNESFKFVVTDTECRSSSLNYAAA